MRPTAAAATTRYAVALALVLAVKWGSLTEPPFWDTAMGLFPAAITLAGNGFDLIELLGMPGYLDGGPNAHGTSPVTLATALVLMLVGTGPAAFVVLHILHFAVAAWALVLLFRLTLPLFGRLAAALLCVAVLLHPTFSAQVGYLYMEVFLFLCAVAAVDAWVRGRLWTAVVWGGMAFATKETGIIVPAALAVAALLERRAIREKALRVLLLFAPAALWTALVVGLERIARAGTEVELVPPLDSFLGVGAYLRRFLLNVPDLMLYFAVFFVALVAFARPMAGALRAEPMEPSGRPPEQHELLVMGLTGSVVVFFTLLFMVALPVVAGFTIVLPRYYVMILPFLLLWVGLFVKRRTAGRSDSAPAGAFLVLAAVFWLNSGGALYPMDVDTEGPGNDPPLTERSNAYRRLLALQLEAMEALESLPPDAPVYYGHFEHYLLQYPELGYASGPLPEGHNLAVEDLHGLLGEGRPFPPCVYALFSYPWLGGEMILDLIRIAEARPDLTSEVVREIRDGPYAILLVAIGTGVADCTP